MTGDVVATLEAKCEGEKCGGRRFTVQPNDMSSKLQNFTLGSVFL